jgi:hypothetical protein
VQDLIRKIQTDAAERLTLPPGREAAQELPRFRSFIKQATHRLKLAHQNGRGGLEVCQLRAAVVDCVIRALWNTAYNNLSQSAKNSFPPIALVALGGYGRGELNPLSDIDLLFLHEGQVANGMKPLPILERMLNGVWLTLFDLGLKPGHAVRSVSECVDAVNDRSDARRIETRTSLIEARLIAGEEKLFAKFQKAVVTKCVEGYEDKYIAARLEDQAERRAKYGNSAFMQEPNIKNGCGGLRDYQNLLWMAFFKYRTRSLAELEKHELVMPRERKQLEAAYDFLLRVRTQLHYLVNRPSDALSKSIQPAVALPLGYSDRSPSKRIEKFMRDFYSHSRNIFIITRTLEQRMAFIKEPPSRLSLRRYLPKGKEVEPVDGFKFIKGEIHATSNRVFRDQPRRLMRVFLHAQQRGLRLHPDLAQLIRSQIALVDREFLRDEHVAETFLTILNQRGNVATILRAMHEVDFLGKYVPSSASSPASCSTSFIISTPRTNTRSSASNSWTASGRRRRRPTAPTRRTSNRSNGRPCCISPALARHRQARRSRQTFRPRRQTRRPRRQAHQARRFGHAHARPAHRASPPDGHHFAAARHGRSVHHPEFCATDRDARDVVVAHAADVCRCPGHERQAVERFQRSTALAIAQRAMPLLTGGTDFVRAEEKQREHPDGGSEGAVAGDLFGGGTHVAHFEALPPRYFQIHSPAKSTMTCCSRTASCAAD